MDGNASMLSSKENNLDGQNNGEGQDRLSYLPASVLHHILSFLPTKYAVGTDNAILDVYCSTTTIDRIIKLLGGICNVEDLDLSNRTIDSLFSREDTLAHVPTFSSLVDLTVTAESGDIDASNLMSLLHKMPCIEYLSFCAPYTFDNYNDIIPQCILSHLKFVELNDFFGSESELRLVKVLLTNGRLLEEITIRSSVELSTDSNKQLEVTKQLLMMTPRASVHCAIDFA
ncbi:Fbd-associated f-box protein [Thalictrum thalictroides]|uniref:Fbd-associated f-box protein n=1 Tax=Thalictrum thalictroides TaxID=46969 RepID=A0A7J6XDF9_THATH|nr:Fbd-associated f-box protein [Thalictrum thalictroides]